MSDKIAPAPPAEYYEKKLRKEREENEKLKKALKSTIELLSFYIVGGNNE